MTDSMFTLDPKHESFLWWEDHLAKEVTAEKYCNGPGEKTIFDVQDRVATAAMGSDGPQYVAAASRAMNAGLIVPAGGLLRAVGTDNNITAMNCFVNGTLVDSMEGIVKGMANTMFTLQMTGGMGTDFSPLRPDRAKLGRYETGARASGPLPFMDWYNAGSLTIRTVGGRNGAMMATLSDWHPDLPKFIVAKQEKDRLTQFNVSILVSDAFMQAVEDDEEWHLYFPIPPIDVDEEDLQIFVDDEGHSNYIYSTWKARDLWDMITRNTYEWSEPGVIFIDRVNDLNNLQYLEVIRCTNPCGEQPLSPHDACDLGHNNLARMVKNPFTTRAKFDFDLLTETVHILVRLLDNVIDITNYPLQEQHDKHHQTRRIGVGFTGLASALAQLRIRYGSIESVRMAERIQQHIAIEAYRASVELAKEKGPFPGFDKDKYFDGFAGRMLPKDLQEEIREHGIRNGVILTIAPTGTTSVAYGDVESGCEPIFALGYWRKRRDENNEWKEYERKAYTWRFYEHCMGEEVPREQLPDYFVTAEDLNVQEHIAIQAAVQKWVDASVSKTINLPEDYPYEEFKQVYALAYHSGCKGCTTYRPSAVRGSVLSTNNGGTVEQVLGRPDQLHGVTYKVKWPSMSAAMYITINQDETGKPYEIFFASKDARYSEWMTALTLMISAIFRSDMDPSFIPTELQQVVSTHDHAWKEGKYWGSLVAYLGHIIGKHLGTNGNAPQLTDFTGEPALSGAGGKVQLLTRATHNGEPCPNCQSPLISEAGCKKCTSCGYSKC